jgi:hypothetical protein
MSRTYSTDIQAQFESKELRPFFLLEMTISGTTYRYTDCDVPIYLSNTYSPIGFKFQPVKYSMGTLLDKFTFTIDNLDSAFSGLFVGSTPQGSAVVLKAVVLDSSYDVVAGSAVTIFEGELDSWDITESQLKATVTSMFHQWSQKTLSKHSPSCRWKVFNSSTLGSTGVECASTAGGAWCDRTYARCLSLGNSTNFGGYRFLPSLVDKDIWWGKVPNNA